MAAISSILAATAIASSVAGIGMQLANKPKTPDAPDAPAIDEAGTAQKAQDAADRQKKQAAAGIGRKDTILTSPLGITGGAGQAGKTILGG